MSLEDDKRRLSEWVGEKPVIYTIRRETSRSGMTKWIDGYSLKDGTLHHIGPVVARLIDRKWNSHKMGVTYEGAGYSPTYEFASDVCFILDIDTDKMHHESL